MNKGLVCISCCVRSADELVEVAKTVSTGCDLIEIRFDCLEPGHVASVLKLVREQRLGKPAILTNRSREQGGRNNASVSERREFWSAVEDPFWAVDIEEDIFPQRSISGRKIASYHDHLGVSGNIEEIFHRLKGSGADIVKIAISAADVVDAISVWQLLNHKDEVDVVPIAMGEAGKWTRILSLAHGAALTYGSLGTGHETASGQISAEDLVELYRTRQISRATAVYGIIGDPVSQSLSPYIHNPAFAQCGVDAVFVPLLVRNLDEFFRRMVSVKTREVELNFQGFSVTMPHKIAVQEHLDEIEPAASKIGAVNTVVLEGERLVGYNTDAPGFIAPLRERFGDLSRSRAAIFGAGGAARACIHALQMEGVDTVLFARNPSKAAALADEFHLTVQSVAVGQRSVHDYDIIIDATPLGMPGLHKDETLFTADALKSVKFVYDLVTSAGDTPLIREAKLAGIPTLGGLEMLIAQGALQFELWTKRPAPKDLMRENVLARIADSRR